MLGGMQSAFPKAVRTFVHSLLFTLVSALAACSGILEDGPSTRDGTGGEDSVEGKLSNNGLKIDLVTLDLLSTKALASLAGAGDDDVLESAPAFADLLSAPGGSELFSYLITCALPETQSVRAVTSNQVFAGNLGVAPQWLHEDCDTSCQRWVSACVMAHANGMGTSVAISPRGANFGLAWTDQMISEFDYQEAAYYGNLFAPRADRQMNVCAGDTLLQNYLGGERGEATLAVSEFLLGRVCGVGACGFTFSGFCQELKIVGVPSGTDTGTGVCNDYHEGYFADCGDGNRPTESSPPEHRFSEVITVYLAPE